MFASVHRFLAILILAIGSATMGVGAANAASTSTGSFSLANTTFTASKTAGSVTMTINRTGGSAGSAAAYYHTTWGTALDDCDYRNTYGWARWAAGDSAPKTIVIPILNITPIKTNRRFTFTVSRASGASLGSSLVATITLTPATTAVTAAVSKIQLSTSSTTVAANAGSVSLSVTRAGGSKGAVSVKYVTANGSAVAGTNFTAVSGTLQWSNGDASTKTVSVPLNSAASFTGSKSFTVALTSPSGGATVSSPGSASVSITSTTSSSNDGPSAVTNLVLTNQGGVNVASNNGSSVSHSQSIKWGAATATAFPISYYQIYRNGTPYATTTALSFTDSAATNSNDVMPSDFSGVHFNAPRTAYEYDVAAVDTQGNTGPQAAQFTYWEHANGVDAWGETAFNPSAPTVLMNWASTVINHDGSASVISVATNSSSQYIQPSAGAPGTPLWSFEAGAFEGGYMVMDIYPTKSGQIFKINTISRVTPGDFYNNAVVYIGSNSGYGPSPMVANTWNHYKIPLAGGTAAAPGLQMGAAEFQGYIAGKRLTVTSVSGTRKINPTDWITGGGMTADYVVGNGPSYQDASATGSGGVGTYDMSISQTVGSAEAPVTFTTQRTNVYKWSMQDQANAGANLWYLDNIGFTTN